RRVHSRFPQQSYRKPCERRHLKIKQVQGQNRLRSCILKPFDKRMPCGILRLRNTRLSTPNVKHEARGIVRESEQRRTDGGKSNPRASTSRQAAWLGCG